MFGLVLIGSGIFAIFNSVSSSLYLSSVHVPLRDLTHSYLPPPPPPSHWQVYDYTNDSYGQQASSGIAGQGLMRNMLAAVGPLFASQMFHNR